MKKVLLTAMTLLSVAASSVFGFYGANADWVDLITEGNVFKARADRLGFALGNGTIKGVFGFKVENEGMGLFFKDDGGSFVFSPTVSAGLAYRTDAFGIGVGYNYTYKAGVMKMEDNDKHGLDIHTPVITMNFLNDSLRIAVPVQVAVKNGDKMEEGYYNNYTGVSLDPQIRYYTGIDAFNELRLTVKYGMNKYSLYKDGKEADLGSGASYEAVSSLGFDFRAYFGAQVGDVGLKPFLKVTYDTALDATGKAYTARPGKYSIDATSVTAGSGFGAIKREGAKNTFDSNPWKLEVLPTLGMSANSDVVSIYLEAGLGYKAVEDGLKTTSVTHALRWNAYGELYVTPIKDLEWYVEAEIGNGDVYAGTAKSMALNASTGINWYLPSFGGDAQ